MNDYMGSVHVYHASAVGLTSEYGYQLICTVYRTVYPDVSGTTQ